MAAFRVLGEREVYVGYKIRVTATQFAAPDGTEFERDVVHHPGAVGVLPLHDDGSVTLVRQFRPPVGEEVLEIPAGLRDVDGEATIDTAARELTEEAGLRAEHLEHLISFCSTPGMSDELVEVYVATGLHDVESALEGIEEQHLTVERMALRDALAMVQDGRIIDAKTVIALTLVALRR